MELHEGKKIAVVTVAARLYGASVPNLADPAAEHERDRLLEEAKLVLARKGIAAATHTVVGDAANCVVVLAAEMEADVIVLGTRGRNALTRAVLGSVSTAVLQRSSSDVLVVRYVLRPLRTSTS